jgi:hypothetical protein
MGGNMAVIFESLSLKGLRRTHLEQLLAYIEHRERDGWYYGNKEQFEKRHTELKGWITNAVVYANQEDVRMPK